MGDIEKWLTAKKLEYKNHERNEKHEKITEETTKSCVAEIELKTTVWIKKT